MSCKVYHKGKYYVTLKKGFDDFKKDITLSIEKVFDADCLKISLTDENDPQFLCNLIIARCDYDELKKQQGLLIDFENFPAQFVRLLQQCATNNMFILVHQPNPIQYCLEIVEHNEFRRLVHLSLKTGLATDAEIKKHMADTISNLKKTLAAIKNSSSSSEMMWNEKCLTMEKKIHDLTHTVSKMEEDRSKREMEFLEIIKQEKDKLNQERISWQKNLELASKSQQVAAQENLSRKDKQIDELNQHCKQLQDRLMQMEKLQSERSQRIELLENEVQKSHIEVATLKAKNANLERDLLDKDQQNKQIISKCSYLEKSVKEQLDSIKDLNSSLQLIKKEKTSLEERLNLSEALANRNNEAARSTSEQLLKANQIITKQNSELIETKDKLLCRTAIALEQEKVIETNAKEINGLKQEVETTKQNIEKLQTELQCLKEKYEVNEKILKDKEDTINNNNLVIQWLHKKMEGNMVIDDHNDIQTVNGTTPYFLSRSKHTNTTDQFSDESINFYATSKLSNLEDSPLQTSGKSRSGGLDPKYLKPATEDIKNAAKKGAKNICQNGKENKNIDLPKVDYREKKSAKSTYRATPVSAFFPR